MSNLARLQILLNSKVIANPSEKGLTITLNPEREGSIEEIAGEICDALEALRDGKTRDITDQSL